MPPASPVGEGPELATIPANPLSLDDMPGPGGDGAAPIEGAGFRDHDRGRESALRFGNAAGGSLPATGAPQLLVLEPHAASGDGGWHFAAEGSYLYGPVHGFLQTPAGGQPGTTSRNRPTFGEVGIHDVSIADAAFTAGYGNHELFVGAQFIQPSGSKTLGRDLISNGVTFPAGTHVHSDVNLDWYRIGYRYRWVLEANQRAQPVWTLYPSLGAALFTFDYKLSGGGMRASRAYSKGLPQVGLEAEWRPGGGPFALSAGAIGFPPIGSIPAIATENVLAKYQLPLAARGGGGAGLQGFAGVQFEQIYSKDSQRVSNHVEADFGPMLIIGIAAGF